MSRAASAVTTPSRRSTSSTPVATAPAITAWSLGKEKSLVRETRTRTCGSVAYGLASPTPWPRNWFRPRAMSAPAGAHSAAETRARSSLRRATHHEASRTVANSTTPYFA